MPNLEAAAEMLGAMNIDAPATETTDAAETQTDDAPVINSEASAEGTETEKTVEEKKDTPSPAELRAREMQERIERLKAQNAERAEKKRIAEYKAAMEAEYKRLEAERAKAEELRKQIAAEEAEHKTKWQAALKDPNAAFRAMGLDPVDAYKKITEAALAEDTPEGREARFREKIRKELLEELNPREKEVASLKERLEKFEAAEKAREEREKAAEQYRIQELQARAHNEFLKITEKSGYETLADYYEPEELIFLGDSLADEMAASGKKFTLEDIATELKTRLETQLKRAEERRSKRTTSKNGESEADQTATAPETGTGTQAKQPEVKTVSNQMASATAATGKRSLTRAERLLAAEKELGAWEKRASKSA